jgi:hypothetical protein
MFETFSDNLKQKIQGSPEWQARNGSSAPAKTASSGFDDMDSDIPF